MSYRLLPWALVLAMVVASCEREPEIAADMIDIGMVPGLGQSNAEYVIATVGRNYADVVNPGTKLWIRSGQDRELRARVFVDRRMDDMVALRIVEWLTDERAVVGDLISMEVRPGP
ncbi:MAG: hypothetical protein EA402_01460 [Planctomycetota bacterium]|nr:MAG: hypothetical protein EA402_01460 [Planctomycetota bacterium]